MLNYIILGIIQGVTEFLPISSDGHLAVMQRILGLGGQEVIVSLVLHLGTVAAVVLFFFKDILKLLRDKKTLLLIGIVTVVTGVIGVPGEKFFTGTARTMNFIAATWIVNGLILILAQRCASGKRTDLNLPDGLCTGIAQGISILPAISRSGITISTLLFRKVDRETAFKFSFLASIPAILGAEILKAKEIIFALEGEPIKLGVGFVFSFAFGILALWIFRRTIKRAKLHYFGYYCIAAAIITLLFLR